MNANETLHTRDPARRAWNYTGTVLEIKNATTIEEVRTIALALACALDLAREFLEEPDEDDTDEVYFAALTRPEGL